MKYTIRDFNRDFPNDETCIKEIFKNRYPLSVCPKCSKKAKFHYVAKRKRFDCQWCGHGIYPLSKTIFHKSRTPLKDWFYVIYLFSNSRNGVSAKEIRRQVGVTYKTAWRMARQIRRLFGANMGLLQGTVEADETYIGGYRKKGYGGKDKTPVIGLVERGGSARAKVVSTRDAYILLNNIRENVKKGSAIMSDKLGTYGKTKKIGYGHDAVDHWKKEFVRGKVHTNTIEGFWSQLKRSLNGTYHAVSKSYLQDYVNEFSWRYSHRHDGALFPLLLAEVVKRA